MGGALDAESKLAAQVRDRLQGEVDYAIPKDKQFLGSVESYYLVDDSWFWLRRILLLVLGILGILFVSKEGLKDIAVLGEKGGLALLAIPYGIIVGFLSPIPLTPTPLGPALGMVTLHVVAEQAFFFVFVGRALLKDAENPAMNAGLAALLFGLYQLSFYSVSQAHMGVMLLGVVQMTAFAGGAYALLLWRSGGILAPMTAHLVINAVMIIRAVTQHSA